MASVVRPRPRAASRRLLRIGPQNKEARKVTAEESAEFYIRNHAMFATLLGALQEGIKVREISRWFASESWLGTVNERTFTEYLNAFRRRNWPLIQKENQDSYDKLISAKQPGTDLDNEVDRLIRLQKLRLGIVVGREKDMGMILAHTHKDVLALGKLLELKANMSGRLLGGETAGGLFNSTGETGEASVRETLTKVGRDEATAGKLYNMTKSLTERAHATVSNEE